MKKKLNKIITFVKKYWYFLLILIPLSFLMGDMKDADNDIWFILNTGRNIIKNGINYTDVFTIHSGLKIIVQQWGTSIIFWILFNKFGKYGILALLLIISIITIIMYYKLCYSVSKKKELSVILTIIFIILIKSFITTRPQIFTYMFLIIELFLLEKYVEKGNKKYLYPLPLISLLMINLHASMWIMQFAFMLTFLLNKINLFNTRVDNYKIKPLIIVTIIMFIVGFINPYTYKSMFFFLYSTSKNINYYVNEMNPFNFKYWLCKETSIIFLLLIFNHTFIKKFRIDIRHFLLICGTCLMMFMHLKCASYFAIASIYSIAYGFKKIDINLFFKNLVNKLNKNLIKIIKTATIACSIIISIFIFINTCYIYVKYSDFTNEYEKMIDKLLEEYDVNDIILYTTYNNGGYAEYRGIKSYIDPRAEIFLKKQNGKEDIFDEMFNIPTENKNDEEYENFISKYGFTHFMVLKNSYFYEYIKKNYKLIYEDDELSESLFVKAKINENDK